MLNDTKFLVGIYVTIVDVSTLRYYMSRSTRQPTLWTLRNVIRADTFRLRVIEVKGMNPETEKPQEV